MDRLTKTWHQMERDSRSLADRAADYVTKMVGSWMFVAIHIFWFGAWALIGIEPFPYTLLTKVVSLEAVIISTFIMMAQNRAADRDHAQAKADFDTNIAAKNEIEDLQQTLARIENDKLDKILKILNEK